MGNTTFSSHLLLLLLFPVALVAQTPPDSLRTLARPDTLKRSSDVDTLIVYSAKDSVIYSMRTHEMHLYGKSDLKFRTMELQAEKIAVNWDTANLLAEGVKDTSDKTGKKSIGLPILKDAGEKYDGTTIGYNFRSKKGKISLANTEFEQGYYHGEEIKRIESDVLFVADGRYTSCELDHPHYYFSSPKMKVMLGDKIVAEPIYLYIADIPVLWLPFGVFPNKSGRRSGIIAPAYGQDSRRGHYLSHFGYYFALSDYYDFTTTFDWFARGGWLNRSLFRYALRYELSGSISANISRTHNGEPDDPDRVEQRDYNIAIYHNQQIDPSTRFDVNFTFATGSYYRNFSTSVDEILRQNIISSATLSKTWEGSNSNLSISLYRDQNLQTGAVDERFPSVSFTQGQMYPFKRSTKSRGLSESSTESWYESIGLSYSAQAQRNRTTQVQTIRSLVDPAQDSTTIETKQERLGVNHQVGINVAPKLGYITVSPFFNYNEKWYNKRIERDSTGTRDVNGFSAVRTFSAGVSASTRFYGILQPQILGITGLRHTVTPSVSFSYQPDFSDEWFGYYGSYRDASGRTVKYSRYEREIYGGAPSGKQENLSVNVGNVFEMKYQGADTSSKEQKIQLMNANASLSYNFEADSLKLSPLSISYRTDIGRYLNISAGTTYDFYVFDTNAGTRVNRFNLSENKYLADLTSVSLSLSTSLSGEKKQSTSQSTYPAKVQEEQARSSAYLVPPTQQESNTGLYGEEIADFSIPWSLGLNYVFSQNQSDPRVKIRSSSVNANLSFSLTENWRFSASGSYDFIQKQFAAPSISIYRDLHCWEMTFSWYPIGFYSGYRFELRVKAPQLQDLKLTKQSSTRSVYSY